MSLCISDAARSFINAPVSHATPSDKRGIRVVKNEAITDKNRNVVKNIIGSIPQKGTVGGDLRKSLEENVVEALNAAEATESPLTDHWLRELVRSLMVQNTLILEQLKNQATKLQE